MPRYNTKFELSIEDMELIEAALRENKRALNSEMIEKDADPLKPCDQTQEINTSLKQISDLLGRLHNQKEFFRPREGAYLGG
jgi:hypothetical protein